jgi:hypothetical protein
LFSKMDPIIDKEKVYQCEGYGSQMRRGWSGGGVGEAYIFEIEKKSPKLIPVNDCLINHNIKLSY